MDKYRSHNTILNPNSRAVPLYFEKLDIARLIFTIEFNPE